MSTNSDSAEVWRVLVVPGLVEGESTSLSNVSLPDPRTGRPQGFMLQGGRLLELNRFKQTHSAWHTGDRLLADGGVFLATAYDPLFMLLPLLDKARDKDEACPAGKYKELNDILYDSTAPDLAALLKEVAEGQALGGGGGGGGAAAQPEAAPAAAADGGVLEPSGSPTKAGSRPRPSLEQSLACVCDVQRVDETAYYRLNDTRVLAWLRVKARHLQSALSAQVAGMEAPHAAAYVLSFLGEYVGEPWAGRLAASLGAETVREAGPGAALQPSNGANTAAPAPRPTPPPPSGGPPEKKQKVDPRAAAKQAALAKQAVGTKKLTSYFTKK
ncbi:hypothetical protein HYH03_014449 [Edaphochlamys debaryana]|uniref:Ribonuclease H2 subunit B wHTH domain-containing protein n=1 Tax=Edaphochlamys debaryana TaxID=47281 RepID=A0A835XP47_9CHLO|nr:hypothetical protein HYH03_014449 [Edaphochlamys debaryana]|eukprot:KAG2486952.1 hypothetical protein HYH03_014449 [Edaphochlamys debaryana]